MFSLPPNFAKVIPKPNKKLQRVQRQRREQLKFILNDVTRIATTEIERFNEFANDLLTEEADNPIILEDRKNQDDNEDQISI